MLLCCGCPYFASAEDLGDYQPVAFTPAPENFGAWRRSAELVLLCCEHRFPVFTGFGKSFSTPLLGSEVQL